jgi:hypothetical protein
MPIRNPFARRPGPLATANDSILTDQERSYSGFERVDTVGSKASSALSIRSARSQDTGEYKMSGMFSASPPLQTIQIVARSSQPTNLLFLYL